LDSGDFSMISRRVVDIMNKMPEESRYLRGMRTWIGFKQIGIEYERAERQAGESKYSLKLLFRLAYNGIFNFSEFPIKFVSRLGAFGVLISLFYFFAVIIKKYFFQEVIEGFTSLLFMIIFFSGIQLFALGVIGEYVLRVFFQSKNRPLYIVKETIVDKNINNSLSE
jgi:dolichol-phosphate mannosyltransferase